MVLRNDVDDSLQEQVLEDEFSLWPMNLLLVLLGSTVITLAFSYLSSTDARLLHNPWTYVVATPIVLMAISLALNTLVSRTIEKSMQMAFLLSVLVHLLFVIGAMNVVIFSRLWPDILESLAYERHQLKRQSLQAKQYYRVTSADKTGARPDYLQFVPTEHEPTELQNERADFSLADQSSENLVSPVPRIERSANPHVIERRIAAPSLAVNDEAASLSRSMTQQSRQQWNQPESMPYLQDTVSPPELQSAAAVQQRRSSTTAPPQSMQLPSLQSPDRQAVTTSIADRATSDALSSTTSLSSAAPASLQRSQTSPETAIRSGEGASRISVPSLPAPQPTMDAGIEAIQNLASQGRSRPSEPAIASLPQPPLPSKVTAPRQAELSPRNESTPPTASAGDLARSIPRQSAGGRTGPAEDASMPVYGFNQTAAKPSTETRLLSPRLETRRRSSEGRSPALAADLGAPRATRWLEAPSVALGKSGQSPVDLAVDALSGSAAVQDVAELSGAARAIQRSQAGFGFPDASVASVPAPVESQALGAESARESRLADSTTAALGSDMAGISRSGVAGTSAADLPNEFAAGPLDSESLGPSLSMDSPSQIANNTLNSGREEPYASRSRMRLQISPPGEGSVEMPTDESPGLASSDTGASGLASVDRGLTARRNSERRETAGLHPLAIEAPPGPGGINVSDTISGSLLPRRRERAFEDSAPDLEVQRFARQDVGGPLAAGQVAMPQPAFQQRRERLRDRNPLDASSAEPQTELAIERGLAFLAKHQRQDGSWRLQDFDTQVLMTSDTAATGLALLAFQGAGYTHKEFKYAEVCEKAIQFLRERQLANGDLYIRQNPASDQNAWLYSHAIAAIAMCEAYGMTQDPELRQPAQRSIDFIVASQDPLRGGWRYRPGSGSDTSVSGWFMMALKSAQLAGLAVPPETFERLSSFLDLSQATDGRDYLYRYNPYAADTPQQRHGLQPTAVMTSVGLLMRLYMGWQRDRAEMIQGADYLLGQLPEHGTEQNSRRDTYYWYYATQVMFHMGGETWRRWHDRLYPLLIEHQVTEGENEGSWEPFAPTPDLWGRYGGRLYVTTMNLLSLEVTYRHLPLYEATAPQTE